MVKLKKQSQNNEKNRWKRVENDEKLNLFWKNKANLNMGEINSKSIITRVYMQYSGLDTWWKQSQFKANSKPILWKGKSKKAKMRAIPEILRGAIWKNKANLPEGEMNLIIYMKGDYEEKAAVLARKNSLVGSNLFQVCDFDPG